MTWLIWKEYRLNRPILLVGAGLLLAPHVIALLVGIRHPEQLRSFLSSSSMMSLTMAQVVLAMLGGNAIAGERNDRSAEFLAYLPVSRARNLVSKLALVPVAILVTWGVNLPILIIFGPGPHRGEQFPEQLAMIAFAGLVLFCACWLASSLMRSGVYAICLGLAGAWLITLGIHGAMWIMGIDLNSQVATQCAVVSIVVGTIAAFVAGSWCYLRRLDG